MDKRVERIKEIEKIRNELKEEQYALEEEIREEKNIIEKAKKDKFVGKCFRLKSSLVKSKSYEQVYAFKILALDKYNPLSCARCLTLIDGYGYGQGIEYGIVNKNILLWSADVHTLKTFSNEKLTIDLFKEISENEFEKLKEEVLLNIEATIESEKDD